MANGCGPFAKLAARLRPRFARPRLFRRRARPAVAHAPHATVRPPASEVCTVAGSPSRSLRAAGASVGAKSMGAKSAGAKGLGAGLLVRGATALAGAGLATGIGYAVLTSATASVLSAAVVSWTAPAPPAPRLAVLAFNRSPSLPVPEPSSLTIVSVGLIGLGALARRRR